MRHTKRYAVVLGVLAVTTACSQVPTTAPAPSEPETQAAPSQETVLPDAQVGEERDTQQLLRRLRDRDDDDDGRDWRRGRDRDDDDDDRDRRRRFRFRFFNIYPFYRSYYQPYYPPIYQPYAQNTVVIRGYQYLPNNINVPIGATVTWINQDSVPHTVTSPLPGQFTTTGAFDGVLQPGQSYSYTFNLPGRIDYYCRYHPYMRGSVTVGGYGGY